MRLLVISYYWPPDNGVGVQRILKFCQYLATRGTEISVVTARHENYNTHPVDAAGISNGNISTVEIGFGFDPIRWFSGAKTYQKQREVSGGAKMTFARKVKKKLMDFVWLNFFIPDARIGWYWPVRKWMNKMLPHTPVDMVISTGPPYTSHLIAMYAHTKFGIPWTVDMRDPWPENTYYNITYRFPWVKSLNRLLEKKVLNRADRVVTVAPMIASLATSKVKDSQKVRVIYNGYDEKEFGSFEGRKNDRFRIGHFGSIVDTQIPERFLKGLGDMLRKKPGFAADFVFEFFGPIGPKALDTITRNIPDKNRTIMNNISRSEVIRQLETEQILFLLINNIAGNELIISSKIFEYLRAGWPVLCIGPVSGEAAQLISRNKCGITCEYEDQNGPANYVMEMYRSWKTGGLQQNCRKDPLYERSAQAGALYDIINDVLHAGSNMQEE